MGFQEQLDSKVEAPGELAEHHRSPDGASVLFHPWAMGSEFGPLLRTFMKLFFSRVRPLESRVEEIRFLASQGRVVYVLRSRSVMEALLWHYQCRMNGLPVPVLACEARTTLFQPLRVVLGRIRGRFTRGGAPDLSRAVREVVRSGHSVIVYLEDQDAFQDRFMKGSLDPLLEVVMLQKELDGPVFLVPQIVVWDRARERIKPRLDELLLGRRAHPSEVRVLINFLRFYRKDSHIFHADPIDLRTFIGSRPEEDASGLVRALRLELWERLRRERKVVTGPVVKPRQDVWETVLKDPRVQQAIERRVRNKGRSPQSVRKEAYRLLKEIAADYDPTFLRFWDWVMRWALKHLFDGLVVDKEGLERVREVARRANLVLVPCHRSHMDYMILGYIFYHNQLYPPLTAAGLNLAFWPMGFLFRKSGAFFIRRDFRGSVLYPSIFSRYLHYLLSEGYPIEFFIEGGRSRTGKMMMPKPGFLAMIIEAFRKGACEDVAFVPVAITYEKVMEEAAYLKEKEGGEKRRENFWELIRSGRVVRKRWGRIFVNFEEPVLLRDYLRGMEEKGKERSRISRQNVADCLGVELVRRINKGVQVVPSSLVAAAIMGAGLRICTMGGIVKMAWALVELLRKRDARIVGELEDGAKLERTVERVLDAFKKEGILKDIPLEEEGDEAPEGRLEVSDRGRRRLDYYKNSIVHFLLFHCLCALSLLRWRNGVIRVDRIVGDVDFLLNILRKEFVVPMEVPTRLRVAEALADLREMGLVWGVGDGLIVPRGKRGELLGIARLIQGILEGYFVVAKSLKYLARRRLSQRAFLWRVRIQGHRLLAKGTVLAPEALSQVLYRNAVELLVEERVIARQVEGGIREGIYLFLNREKKAGRKGWGRFKQLLASYSPSGENHA